MQWIWSIEGVHTQEAETGLNEWLLNAGYQLAVVDATNTELTRGGTADALLKLRSIVHDAAAVVTLLSVLSGDAPPPTSIAERSELVTQAKALAAEVERLQCTYDFQLMLVSPETGEKQAFSSADINELIQRLCND